MNPFNIIKDNRKKKHLKKSSEDDPNLVFGLKTKVSLKKRE